MLFMIVFIGIASVQLPAAIGLYWIVTNAFGVIQTAIINNTAKTIRTVLERGNHKEAKNKGNTIAEYQEMFANI